MLHTTCMLNIKETTKKKHINTQKHYLTLYSKKDNKKICVHILKL